MFKIKKTSEKSIIPKKSSEFAAGYDLFSIEESITLQSLERKLFKTGIHIQIPVGYYGRIAPRSGLSLKQGIDVMAGIIDSDYTGEIGIILVNLNEGPTTVDTTKPIAQFIIERHYDDDFELVTELPETTRGSGGYGSTDEKKFHITERKPKPIEPPKTSVNLLSRFKESTTGTELTEITQKYESAIREREKQLG